MKIFLMPADQRKSIAIAMIILVMALPLSGYLYIRNIILLSPLPVNNKVPSAAIVSIDGSITTTDSLFVKNTVAIFFTTSCEHCRIEMIDMNSYYPEFKNRIDFIGISFDSRTMTAEFAKKHNISFPIYFDTTGIAKKQFRILPMPALYYIDSRKKLIKYQAGEQHKDSLKKTLIKFAIISNDSLSVL